MNSLTGISQTATVPYMATTTAPVETLHCNVSTPRRAEKPPMETCNAPVGAGHTLPLHRDATIPHAATCAAVVGAGLKPAPTPRCPANTTVTYTATDNGVGAYGIRPITTTHKTTRAATVATCGIETGRIPYAPTSRCAENVTITHAIPNEVVIAGLTRNPLQSRFFMGGLQVKPADSVRPAMTALCYYVRHCQLSIVNCQLNNPINLDNLMKIVVQTKELPHTTTAAAPDSGATHCAATMQACETCTQEEYNNHKNCIIYKLNP